MADEPEASDVEADAALDRIRAAFSERSRLIARKAGKSGGVFAISIAAAAIFLKGMPLYFLFRPWGQILLVVCALSFAVALLDTAILLGDWFDRRKLNRSSR